MKKVYSIEGIDCANCAAKIEDKINKIKEIDEANLNFMMEKLSIEFKASSIFLQLIPASTSIFVFSLSTNKLFPLLPLYKLQKFSICISSF